MIDVPRGPFTCHSPAILVLFDSGLFHGLFLTVLGVPELFPRVTIPMVRLCVRRQHSHFWLILACLWTITHRCGVLK